MTKLYDNEIIPKKSGFTPYNSNPFDTTALLEDFDRYGYESVREGFLEGLAIIRRLMTQERINETPI